mgnify:CR=1 FL=1
MKEYVVIKFEANVLVFDFRTIDKEEKAFVNSNNEFKDSLFYDLKYFKRNYEKIVSNIKAKHTNLNLVRVVRLVTFKYISYIIKELNLECLILDFLSTMDVEDYELFLQCSSLKEIYCYFMSSDFIYKFKEKNIEVHISSEKKISDKFLELHDTDNKDSLYYKKVITISEEYPLLIEDLKEFLKINYKLKAIHIRVYSKELIDSIVDLVKNDESRNVVIFLHQENDKGNFIVNNFKWLKELSDKCKEDYTCEFRIIYSNAFLGKNLFKQLTFNNLKLILILCIYISAVTLVIMKSYEYVEKMSIASLNSELLNNQEPDNEEEEDEVFEETLTDTDREMEEEIPQEVIKSKYTFDKSFKKLLSINKETVAYLTVKNTQISYPVVQHSDNSYYLGRDFYKKKTVMGWVYMDYRNNPKEFDDNTIIYGHNMKNGTMFGSLKKVLDSSWRKNEENMTISLDLPTGSYKFKIFSIYKVDYTTDYLITKFHSKSSKEDFINMITKRSIFNSGIKVGLDDKILTLSTCTGSNNRRLVVHAVLVKEGEE